MYRRHICKKCQANRDKERWKTYGKRPEVIKRTKEYRDENREETRRKRREVYKKNKIYKIFEKVCDECGKIIKTKYYNQIWCCDICKKEGRIKYNDGYRKTHKARWNELAMKRHNRYMHKPLYVLRRRCRIRLNDILNSKNKSTPKYLGCSIDELKKHLESKFKEGMSWENMGEWHIDHIIPLCSATDEEEIYRLCRYRNLQPLWRWENSKKATMDRMGKYPNIFKV